MKTELHFPWSALTNQNAFKVMSFIAFYYKRLKIFHQKTRTPATTIFMLNSRTYITWGWLLARTFTDSSFLCSSSLWPTKWLTASAFIHANMQNTRISVYSCLAKHFAIIESPKSHQSRSPTTGSSGHDGNFEWRRQSRLLLIIFWPTGAATVPLFVAKSCQDVKTGN